MFYHGYKEVVLNVSPFYVFFVYRCKMGCLDCGLLEKLFFMYPAFYLETWAFNNNSFFLSGRRGMLVC